MPVKSKEKNREYVRAFRERLNQRIMSKAVNKGGERKTLADYRGKAKEQHIALKQEVLTYYGGGTCGCVKCAETRIACLSIDHIHGHGHRERKARKLDSTHQFYTWLKNNNFPEGYQTLCMNCQFVKRFLNHEEKNKGSSDLVAVLWK